jgi:hypothetical protein
MVNDDFANRTDLYAKVTGNDTPLRLTHGASSVLHGSAGMVAGSEEHCFLPVGRSAERFRHFPDISAGDRNARSVVQSAPRGSVPS